MSKKRSKKKLALKRETLRKLDPGELGQAAGGAVARTTYCATGACAGYTQSGGCTENGIEELQYVFNVKYYG